MIGMAKRSPQSSRRTPNTRVAEFRPRVRDIENLIRELAKDSRNVRWRSKQYETHVASRMDWRDITDQMMFEVLRTGFVKGDITPGRAPGEWKVKMCKEMKGRREVGVVTIVINQKRLFIKTVEWEDL
jgi:hypothetical protein